MVERTRYLDELIKLKDKHIIKVVTGIRRAGKSTLFTLYRKKLIEFGVDEKHIINLNFEDPEHMNFSHWKELYDYIEQKLDNNKMNYIFLDEIQIMIYYWFQFIYVIGRTSHFFDWQIYANTYFAIIIR